MSAWSSAIAAFALTALTVACSPHELAELPLDHSVEVRHLLPSRIFPKLDILFVIDDSGSMREEQASLAANFPRFMEVLANLNGGLPDVHVGVVSTDLGAGGQAVDTCRGDGEGGVLQRGGPDCTGPDDAFLADAPTADGDRARNYPAGQLAETFACMATLGTDGCGFEQPLEAMRWALDDHPSNRGFLRDDAWLAVIFITDEDDCSARGPQLFAAPDDELGPLHSFRCFEHGVICDPDDPRAPGEKLGCRPRAGSPYLHDVQPYVDFLRNLKGDPHKVLVAGIVGSAEPVRVALDTDSSGAEIATLEPSCSSAAGEAAPPVRLHAFLESFPGRHTITSICNGDLSKAMQLIAVGFVESLLLPCIASQLADTDPALPGIQPECTVADQVRGGPETVLPACSETATLPCYLIEPEPLCTSTPTGLAFYVCRGQDRVDHPACPDGPYHDVSPGALTTLRCRVE